MANRTESILTEVREHRQFQEQMWGQQEHDPFVWLAILMEEVGEVAEAMVRGQHTLERDYRIELLQVAAVAVAAIESWDRQSDGRDTVKEG